MLLQLSCTRPRAEVHVKLMRPIGLLVIIAVQLLHTMLALHEFKPLRYLQMHFQQLANDIYCHSPFSHNLCCCSQALYCQLFNYLCLLLLLMLSVGICNLI